jgi:hypothetical protein
VVVRTFQLDLPKGLKGDAQSIYQKKRRTFNFASVGLQAQGRTSVLKLNYRNTAKVLALAMVQRVRNSLDAVAQRFAA